MKDNIEELRGCLEARMEQYGEDTDPSSSSTSSYTQQPRARGHRARAPSAPELQPTDSRELTRSR